MNKRNAIVIAILALIMVAGVPFLYAQHQHGMHGGMHGMHGGAFADFGLGHLQRAKEYLDLTDAQVDQLKAIGQSLREQNAPLREQLRGGFGNVAQTLLANPNDLAAAQAQLDKQEQLERTMKSNALAAASKALNVLTPEQRAKVSTFLANRAARRHAHD